MLVVYFKWELASEGLVGEHSGLALGFAGEAVPLLVTTREME